MKLSDLTKQGDETQEAWGIEADEECLTPPADMTRISFVWKGKDGNIDDTLLDAIISFGMSDVDVILEVTPRDNIKVKDLTQLAANAGFSLAILPEDTEAKDESVWDAWGDLCATFCEGFLTTRNFTKDIHPVSGYFGHVVQNILANSESSTPTDSYLLERFVNPISEAHSNAAKIKMLQSFEDTVGGKEELKLFVQQLASEIAIEAANLHFENVDPETLSKAQEQSTKTN